MFPDTFVAWNPTTGESRKHPATISFGNGSKWFCGFGYDCLGRDHKLVVVVDPVVTKSNQDVEFNPCVVLDYSLKSTSARYKYFSGRIGFEPRMHSAVYSNHHLYWDGKAFDPSCADPNMKREDAVLTYNLQAEVFNYLPLPHNERGVFQGIAAIKDGDLCASFYSFVSPRFMVWVMKEYGVSSPWTLLYSFDDRPHLYRRWPLWDGYQTLLGISSDGYLVVDNVKDVSIIVPVDGAPTAYMSYKTVPKEDERFETVEFRSWIYEESLLPPNTEDANLNMFGYGRFRRHQSDEAEGGSSKLKKQRKLGQHLCIKTALCKAWRLTGRCTFGDDCLFAHGMHELRTKICRDFLDGGTCASCVKKERNSPCLKQRKRNKKGKKLMSR